MARIPRSLQARTTLVLTGLCFGIGALSAIILFIYVAAKVVDEEREELTAFADRLEAVIDSVEPTAANTQLDEALRLELDEKMDLVFDPDDYNLSYVIYDKTGNVVHAYAGDGEPPDTIAPRFDPFYLVASGYKEWTFFVGLETSRFDAVLASSHKFEVLDDLLVGLAILLPVALFFSLLAADRLTTQILVPLRNIETGANRIAGGSLDARIAKTGQGDEADALIDTLNETFSQLEEAFVRIEQFSSDAAHELRTPLTAVRGNLEVCLRHPRSTEEYQAAIADAIDEIAQLNGITENLLNLAKSPDQFIHDFALVDLSELLTNAAEQMSFLADQNELKLEADIAPNVSIDGLSRLLTQLVYNLLQNAIRYTPAPGTVRLCLKAIADDQVEITVSDTGPGIPAELQEKVFARFFRASESRRQQGTGLGLAIAKWVVDCHSGDITIDSTPGNGAIFRVCLPTAPAGQSEPSPSPGRQPE